MSFDPDFKVIPDPDQWQDDFRKLKSGKEGWLILCVAIAPVTHWQFWNIRRTGPVCSDTIPTLRDSREIRLGRREGAGDVQWALHKSKAFKIFLSVTGFSFPRGLVYLNRSTLRIDAIQIWDFAALNLARDRLNRSWWDDSSVSKHYSLIIYGSAEKNFSFFRTLLTWLQLARQRKNVKAQQINFHQLADMAYGAPMGRIIQPVAVQCTRLANSVYLNCFLIPVLTWTFT